jgi:CopG family transcriptional regulator, nickel-responsive regulator
MQRTTITLDDDLDARLDDYMKERGYANRSEAIRDLVRSGLETQLLSDSPDKPCIGAAVYVYDHEARDLARRLTGIGHDHHDLSLATMHVHLDHESCLEVSVLRGSSGDVRHFADHIISERGVRYGRLVLVPVEPSIDEHAHGQGHMRHTHLHVTRK